MSERSVSITTKDLQAIAKFALALEELAKTEGECYLDGKIRVRNSHGWSPGYFEFEEDWVTFYADYEETL